MEIRRLEISDAAEYLAFLQQIAQETDNLFFTKSEVDYPVERQRNMIDADLKAGRNYTLIAVDSGKIIGYLGAFVGFYKKIAHVLSYNVAVLEGYQNKGIGARLIEVAEKIAQEKEIKRIEIGLMASNTGAHRFYQRLGYQDEYRKEKSIYMNGEFVSTLHMVKFL